MSKAKKITITAVCIFVCFGLILGAAFLVAANRCKKVVNSFTFSRLELSEVPDGEYTGSCDAGLVAAEVKVKVENHKIVKIDLLQHKNGKGKPGEAVVKEVIEKQSLNVDAVSGATNSSKVILKAIENALQ